MEKQLVLFVEPDPIEAELVAMLEQLPSASTETATQLLAELMSRILERSQSRESNVRAKEGENE